MIKWSTISQDDRYAKASTEQKAIIKEDWYEQQIKSHPQYKPELDTQIRKDVFGEKPSTKLEGDFGKKRLGVPDELPETRSRLGLGPAKAPGAEPYGSVQYPLASLYSQVEKFGRGLIGLPWQILKETPDRIFGKYKDKFGKVGLAGFEPETKDFLDRGVKEFQNEINLQAERWNQPGPITERVLATRQVISQNAKVRLGDAGEVMSNLMFLGEDLGSMLIQMGLVGKTFPAGTKTQHLGRLAAHGFVTTQGNLTDRAKSAVYRVAYNMTPSIVNATGLTGLKATTVDVMLNSWITSPTYIESYKRNGLNKDFFKEAIPQFFTDVVMALGTRGLPQNQRQVIMDKYYKEFVTKAPELKTPRDEFNKIQEKIQDVVEKEKIKETKPEEATPPVTKEVAKTPKELWEQQRRERAEKRAKKGEKVVKAKPGLKVLPQKIQLLKQLQEAVKKAPSEKSLKGKKPGKITFETDGDASIINTKEALLRFHEIIRKTPERISEKGPKTISTTPTAAKEEKVNELMKGMPEGWTSDGKIIIKGKVKGKEGEREFPKGTGMKEINKFLKGKTKKATFQNYVIDTEDIKGTSLDPIATMKDQYGNKQSALAVFKTEAGWYTYEQPRYNIIRNRYPNATYGIGDRGALIAYDKGEAVAVLMPLSKSGKDFPLKEAPLRGLEDRAEREKVEKPVKKVVKEPIAVKEKTDVTEDAWLESAEGKAFGKLADREAKLIKIRPQTPAIKKQIADIGKKQGILEEKFIKSQKKPNKKIDIAKMEEVIYKGEKYKIIGKFEGNIQIHPVGKPLYVDENDILRPSETEKNKMAGKYIDRGQIDKPKRKAMIEPTPSKGIEPGKPYTALMREPITNAENYGTFDKGVSRGPKPKVIPPVTASQETLVFPKEGGRHIFDIYEKEIGPVLQMSKRMKRYLGVYYGGKGKGSGLIRVKSVERLDVLAHETGHFLDDVLSRYPVDMAVREELVAVTKWRTPFEEQYTYKVDPSGKATKKQHWYTAYRRSRTELFADYLSVFVTDEAIAEKLAPTFTKEVRAQIAKDKEFAWIVKKLREYNAEFQVLKDYVDGLRKIPEIESNIKEWGEKGNLLQELWREKIGNIVWDKIRTTVDKIGTTAIGRLFTEKKGLHDTAFEILRQRRHLIDGQFLRATEEIIKPISKMGKKDQEQIAQNLQRFEILEPTSELNKLSEEARRELAVWGNEAKKLGLLNEESFWNQIGQYFPFFYSSREFAQNKASFGMGMSKTLRANLSSFKHRMSDEDFGKRMLEMRFGTYPNAKKKIAEFTKEQVIAIGKKAREELGLMKTAAYPLQKRLRLLMQSVYTTKAMNAITRIPGILGTKDMAGYEQLPKSKGLGNLSEQWVPKNLATEINSFNEKSNAFVKTVEVINSIWKNFKVPYDPAAMTRNAVTNMVALWMSDIPVHDPRVLIGGINSFIRKDSTYKLLRDRGMYRHTYSEVELGKLAFIMESEPNTTLGHIIKWAITTFETPGKVYGAIEDASKTVGAKYILGKGASVEQGIKLMDKWLFDYSSVSPAVGMARKFPMPFVTWSAKIFPRLVETAVRKPEKYIFVYAALAVANAVARQKLGISHEEEQKMKPEYLQNKLKPMILLPWRDKDDQVQWVDLSYFVPWGGWIDTIKGTVIPQPLQFGNPFISMYNAYVQNYDPFSGEIMKSYQTEKERGEARGRYLRRALLPDILGGGGTEKIIKGIRQAPEDYDYYGRRPDLSKILAGELSGFKTILGGENTTKITNFQREEGKRLGEINRNALLAWENYYRNRTVSSRVEARDALKQVERQSRARIKKTARENVKYETDVLRKTKRKLSTREKRKFRRY